MYLIPLHVSRAGWMDPAAAGTHAGVALHEVDQLDNGVYSIRNIIGVQKKAQQLCIGFLRNVDARSLTP